MALLTLIEFLLLFLILETLFALGDK